MIRIFGQELQLYQNHKMVLKKMKKNSLRSKFSANSSYILAALSNGNIRAIILPSALAKITIVLKKKKKNNSSALKAY